MWIVDRNSGINIRQLYSRPSGVILSNDINGIKPLDPIEVPGSSYREISSIDYDIQNATAQINASQGSSNVGRAFGRTATGVQFFQNFTSSRISLKVRLIDNLVMKKWGKILLLLNRQFVNDDQWVRVTNNPDNPFKNLPMEAFYREYDFSAVSALDRLNKVQRQQNLQNNLVPFLQFIEQAQPGTLKYDKLVDSYLKEFDWKNPATLINSPEERQAIQMRNFAQQVAQDRGKMDAQADAQSRLAQVQAAAKAGLIQ